MSASQYRVVTGPEGYLSPAAASMGIILPEPGEGLIEGMIVPEREAMSKIAEKLLAAKNAGKSSRSKDYSDARLSAQVSDDQS